MINTFLRSRGLSLLKGFQVNQIEVLAQRLSSFTARNIFQEISDETGTLLTRFAKHVALELQKESPMVPTEIRYADFFPITDTRYLQKEMSRISPDQLPALIIFTFTYRPSADPNKYAALLNELDATGMRLLPHMDIDTILRTLYSFLYLMPNWLTQLDFYNAAMKHVTRNDIASNLSTEKFIQICFYLGMEKNRKGQHAESFSKLLNEHLEANLPKLRTLDLVMVSNAAFKTSTRIESSAYNQRLVEEVLKLSLDETTNDALLITLIKAMRLQRVHSHGVCERLKEFCTQNIIGKLQIRGCIHLFAYLADNLWDDRSTVEPLVNHCLSRLLQTQNFDMPSENVRGKDITTFIWCCAQLNYKLTEKDFKQIESTLLNKVNQNEFRYFVDQLVDSCLSLWTLGHKPRELIETAVDLKLGSQFNKRNELRNQPKIENRLQVLLSSVSIEEPTWRFQNVKALTEPKVDTPAPSYMLRDRKILVDMAKKLAECESVATAKLVCPINGINIPSILVSCKEPTNSMIFVELLPEEQELQFSKSPIGIMSLKIRLLKSMGHKVIILPANEYNDESNLEHLISNVDIDDGPEAQSLKV